MKAIIKAILQTYNDYPEAVSNNAKKGIELNEKRKNKCATPVGKIRAQQLAQKKNLSVATIKRMYSYLSRAKEYYDPSDKEACGYISYMLWGGLAGLNWSRSKLKELGEIEMAEVGPRGGIRKSPSAPGSVKGPGKKGSKKNPKGAAGKSGGVKVTEAAEKALRKKVDNFNEKYKEKLGYGVTIGQLKSVYQRGVGAFQTTHSPKVSSQEQWGYARVNAFLYLVKNGRPQNKGYTQDNDLLPSKHPKKGQKPKDKK